MNKFCEKCGVNQATEKHHLLSNSKKNREVYGKLLDRYYNIQHLCYGCHHNKSLDKLTEAEFRSLAILAGDDLPDGTKTFQLRKFKNESNTRIL